MKNETRLSSVGELEYTIWAALSHEILMARRVVCFKVIYSIVTFQIEASIAMLFSQDLHFPTEKTEHPFSS